MTLEDSARAWLTHEDQSIPGPCTLHEIAHSVYLHRPLFSTYVAKHYRMATYHVVPSGLHISGFIKEDDDVRALVSIAVYEMK